MKKQLFFSALVGGMILFIWNAYNWAYIPWSCTQINRFENESEVILALQKNVNKSGMYILPTVPCHFRNLSPFWRTAIEKENLQEKTHNFYMFSAISLKGSAEEKYLPFIPSFFLNLFGACALTWVLYLVRALSYWKKVALVTGLGFLMGLMSFMPFWIWEGFSIYFVAFSVLFPTVGWFIASLFMSQIIRSSPLQEQ